ncbi:hypothetical protein CEXT_237501 [Caerostris extrusa]|uniref:Uncharacterized protein n=1 Tax=Caerostris extrusa TaxID=172846 RepID=A0AAV4Y9A8_CAEEX|nr:hypothetical protein CEXT_237501 [Caerostris extrusa]
MVTLIIFCTRELNSVGSSVNSNRPTLFQRLNQAMALAEALWCCHQATGRQHYSIPLVKTNCENRCLVLLFFYEDEKSLSLSLQAG